MYLYRLLYVTVILICTQLEIIVDYLFFISLKWLDQNILLLGIRAKNNIYVHINVAIKATGSKMSAYQHRERIVNQLSQVSISKFLKI